MNKQKYGIVFCAYGNPQYVEQCLKPWVEAKKKHNILIAATHGQFLEYSKNGVVDNDYETQYKLNTEFTNGNIDFLYLQNNYRLSLPPRFKKEHEIRNEAVRALKTVGVDYYFLLDLDEQYSTEEIDQIFEYINRPDNQMYAYFNISFKNIVFDGTKYIKGFCPPRVFRNKYQNLTFDSLFFDNDVVYSDGVNLVKDKQLPNKKIPKVEVKHYTWLNEGGKAKVLYQNTHFGKGLCSFCWNEEKKCLEFNEEYFRLTGQIKPVLYSL